MIAPRPRDAVLHQGIQLAKLLLVEGETPAHFFEAMAKHLGLDRQIEIRSYGGLEQLAVFLRAIAATAAFRLLVRSVGIIRDAEDDCERAVASVRDAISKANVPKEVKVIYYILPNN